MAIKMVIIKDITDPFYVSGVFIKMENVFLKPIDIFSPLPQTLTTVRFDDGHKTSDFATVTIV